MGQIRSSYTGPLEANSANKSGFCLSAGMNLHSNAIGTALDLDLNFDQDNPTIAKSLAISNGAERKR